MAKRGADRDEGAQALGRVFGAMVGSTISVVMAPTGAIQRIEGVQQVYDKIVKDLPTDRSATQMAASLKSVLSEEAIRAALEQSFPRMPPQPRHGPRRSRWAARAPDASRARRP